MTSDIEPNEELHTQIQYRLIEKLSESERRYRELVESLQEIVFQSNEKGQLTFLNYAWTEILGYNQEESLGKPIHDFLHPEDQTVFQNLLTQLSGHDLVDSMAPSNSKILPNRQELRFYNQTGEIVYLELSARWIKLSNLDPSKEGLSGSLIDITARKQAQMREREKAELAEITLQKLQQTQIQLIQTEKMSSLGQLVAGVAHELNNPINFIYANLVYAQQYTEDLLRLVQLYQQQYPNPTVEIQQIIKSIDLDFLQVDLNKLLRSMQVGTERIKNIVKSLRTFSRLDEAEIKAVNIHEGIDSSLMLLHQHLQPKEDYPAIQVIKKYGQLPLIECYPGQLNQVFMNILSNAIDALNRNNQKKTIEEINNDPSKITIHTALLDSDWVEISIKDNGPGITAGIKQRIFDPFFTTKPVGEGTGLGLSVSYQIVVVNHSGTIECISVVGKGAEFRITIPIKQITTHSP